MRIWLAICLVAATADAGHKHKKPAKLTVHIKNPTGSPVAIDTTYGFGSFPHAPFCQAECPRCDRRECGSPLHTEQKIRAHGSFDAEWDAIDYAGTQGDGGCGCFTATPMAAGPQTITVTGTNAAGADCSGSVDVTLPTRKKRVTVVLACDATPDPDDIR